MKRTLRHLTALTAVCLSAGAVQAHPHIFVDTTLMLSGDGEGNVTSVDVTWRYDDLFTLLILEDMGLDPDGDGVLTDSELTSLKGFDLENWPDGFEGDLYLFSGDDKVEMGLPEPVSVAVEDGRIVATHRRTVTPVAAEGLRIMQYDPTFYVAYEVTGGVYLPTGCAAEIAKPDLDKASAELEKALNEATEDMYEVLELGIHYADRITVSCASSS